ncbi:uncharacterized protein LOC132296515 [Cornus florida]|uniref:uncharacterized protein LOC132296515 n=1 Tax=Cornus florida TaxID=4283 RepID=UPI00289FC5E8|nr:uncharacterized protein LOC132296515 [Cornus florida]
MERRTRRRRTESVWTTLSTNCNCNEEEEKQSCVVDLPFSIVVDILSGLPIRTLLKCRSVCKTWQHSILGDPYFARDVIVNNIVIPVEGSLYLLELGEDSNYVHRPHWPISPTTGRCKVLRFSYPNHYSNVVEVYTLGTDTWRYVGEAPSPTHGIEWCDVTLNGAVHWIDLGFTNIYSFDIDEEHSILSQLFLNGVT